MTTDLPHSGSHPVSGGALNTNHGHPDPCHKSPLAITRTPSAIGGKNGGKILFFLAVTTVLGMHPAKSSTQPRNAKTWSALKFKWAPVLAFKAGMSCSQNVVLIPNPSRLRSFKSVPSPALRLPASPSAIASTQTSYTNGFGCKRRKVRRFNPHSSRYPYKQRRTYLRISALRFCTRAAPSK